MFENLKVYQKAVDLIARISSLSHVGPPRSALLCWKSLVGAGSLDKWGRQPSLQIVRLSV